VRTGTIFPLLTLGRINRAHGFKHGLKPRGDLSYLSSWNLTETRERPFSITVKGSSPRVRGRSDYAHGSHPLAMRGGVKEARPTSPGEKRRLGAAMGYCSLLSRLKRKILFFAPTGWNYFMAIETTEGWYRVD